jgi:hypothetical protein
MMDSSAPTVVATTFMDSEASVIKRLLESYSIPCHYSSEIPHALYPITIDGLGEIRIYVPGALADEARRILSEHRRIHMHLRLIEPAGPAETP